MNRLRYTRADDRGARAAPAAAGRPAFIAGGTKLVDLMKRDVERPARLVDITRLPLAEIVEPPPTAACASARWRATATLANHPLVREPLPAASQALLAGASPQLRNMATIGGNLLQRTRCPYFRDTAFAVQQARARLRLRARCEGSTACTPCSAPATRASPTHPSDMGVALAALDATVVIAWADGERAIAVRRLPPPARRHAADATPSSRPAS